MVRAGSGQEPQAMKRNCNFFCVCLLYLFVACCICLFVCLLYLFVVFVCWAINAPGDGEELSLPDQRRIIITPSCLIEMITLVTMMRLGESGDSSRRGEKKSGNAGGRKRSTALGGSHSFPPITGLTEFSLTEFSLTECT